MAPVLVPRMRGKKAAVCPRFAPISDNQTPRRSP